MKTSKEKEEFTDELEELVERGPIDVVLLTIILVLVGIGLISVYSGSAIGAYFSSSDGDDLFYLKRQAGGALVGVLAMMVGSRIDYDWYRRNIYWFVGIALAALALTRVPGIAMTVNGATRWIVIAGVRFQPAELVKIVTVMFLAYSVSKKKESMKQFVDAFVPHAVVFMPFIVLLMMQPDLGSSVIVSSMVGIMLFVGGARMSYLVGFVTMGGVLVFSAIQSASYRLDRITAWLDPWEDAADTGYQLINSYIALANGGLSGTGFGEGRGRLGYIPELYNDFVAAAVGEEFGMIGMATLATLYVLFLWRGVTIAFRARDAFGAYLAFGLTTLITLQASVNLSVVTGLLPTKGLTLPFVSYGRSSLILLMAAAGILLNISQRNPNLWREALDDRARDIMQNTLENKALQRRKRRRSRQLKAVGRDKEDPS